jgi:hypothetical protein
VNTQDFDIIQTLATGAVGKVCLVREKNDKKNVYAMKILKKQDLLTRSEAAFFMVLYLIIKSNFVGGTRCTSFCAIKSMDDDPPFCISRRRTSLSRIMIILTNRSWNMQAADLLEIY